jgi:hypothetical protein
MGFTSGRVRCCATAAVVMAALSGVRHPAGAQDFRRGDANTDGRVDIGDATFVGTYLFTGEVTPTCLNSAEVNDDGLINLSDPIYLLNWAFVGGGSVPSSCVGPGSTDLGCSSYPAALCDPQPPRSEDPRFELRFDAPATVEGSSGGTAVFDVTVEACNSVGVESWSFGVATSGCKILSYTTMGTLADFQGNGGLRNPDNSFAKSQVIDPSKNGGQTGIVSAILLDSSWSSGAALPVTGTGAACTEPSAILKITLEADVPGECCTPCELTFTDGLVGSGQPVATVVTASNATREVAKPTLFEASVDVGPAPVIEFRRGDANADGRVTIADGVWITNELFRSGPPTECRHSGDVNDDGQLDVSDAVYLYLWNLLGGPAPPAPGPTSCGPDPTASTLACDDYPAGCSPPPARPSRRGVTMSFAGPVSVAEGATFETAIVLDTADAVQAFTVAVEAAGAAILDISPGSAVENSDLFAPFVSDTFATVGVVMDSDGEGAEIIAPGSGLEVLTLSVRGGACPGGTLAFREEFDAGGRPAGTAVVVGGRDFRPALRSLELPPSAGPLSIDTPVTWPLGTCRLFRVEPPYAGSLVASLTGAPLQENALYLRFGAPPTPSLFDAAADGRRRPSQRLAVASPPALPAYVLVQSNGSGAASDVTLRVDDVALALESLSADSSRAAGAGLLHASVLGAGFEPGTAFRLEPEAGGGPAIETSQSLLVSSSRAEVVFDLAGAAASRHDLVAETSALGQSARLEDAFTVLTTSIGPRLEVSIRGARQGSRAFRYERSSRLTLAYRNTGDEEMPAPLFKVTGPAGTGFKLPSEEAYQPGEVHVLGIHPGGVPGWLPPGGGWEIPIDFRSTACRNCPIVFEVLVLSPTPLDAVGWDVLPPPPGMAAPDWERAWPGLSRRLGGTWLEYGRNLAELARRLSHRGEDASSVLGLIRFAAREALGRPSSALTGMLVLDGSGERLPGRTVLARDEDGAVVSSTVTDAGGAFALDWLEGGKEYEVLVLDHRVLRTSLGGRRVTAPAGGDVLGVEVVAAVEATSVQPACANCDEGGLPLAPIAPPPYLFTVAARWEADLVSSWDPNDKEGPDGEDRDERMRLIPPDEPIEYTIHFENRPQAGASAQEVVVTDFLDPLVHDISSVRLQRVEIAGFGLDLDIQGAELASGYTRDLAFERFEARRRLELGLEASEPEEPARIDVAFEATVGPGPSTPAAPPATVTWTFIALTDDPLLGFLDPNCKPGCDCASLPSNGPDEDGCKDGRGEGHVTFSVMPLPAVPEGTVVENRAEVKFDGQPHEGEPLRWENEISHFTAPPPATAPVPPSGAVVNGPDVELSWEAPPGAESFDLHVWLAGTERGAPVAAGIDETSFTARGLLPGERYLWQVVARGADGETGSPEWVFATSPQGPCPAKPVALSPADGAADLSRSVPFAWSVSPPPEPGSISYELLVWKTGQPQRRILASGLFLTAFEAPIELEPGATYEWQVVAQRPGCRKESDVRSFSVEQRSFRRGDPNADTMTNITDAIFLLNYLFSGGEAPPCEKSADTDGGGTVDITDGISLLNYLFASGRPPVAPFDACGLDPEPDGLGCIDYPACP